MTDAFKFQRSTGGILLVACGALGKEVIQVIEHNQLHEIDVHCLPAQLHHRPHLIPGKLDELMAIKKPHYSQIFVGLRGIEWVNRSDKFTIVPV